MFAFFMLVLFGSAATAQTITISYVPEGQNLHAFAVSDDTPVKTWDQYLSASDIALYQSDPGTMDAIEVSRAAQQFYPAPAVVDAPQVLQARTARLAVDDATATVTAFQAAKAQAVDAQQVDMKAKESSPAVAAPQIQ